MRPQFGSAPKNAVLTRALSATVLAIVRASASVRVPSTWMRDEMARPLRIAGHVAGQFLTHTDRGRAEFVKRLSHQLRAGAVGQEDQRIVGARVPFDADAVERLIGGERRQRGQIGGIDGGIGQHKRQHRRHVRADHRRPLGESGDRTTAPFTFSVACGFWLACRSSGWPVPLVRAPSPPAANSRAAFGMPVSITCIGNNRPMTPVEQTSICSCVEAERVGGQRGHAAGVVHALLPGAGVGVAGADDDAAHIGCGQAFPANMDRGGADTVLREYTGGCGGTIADDERQIEPAGLIRAQAGMDARKRNPPGKCEVCMRISIGIDLAACGLAFGWRRANAKLKAGDFSARFFLPILRRKRKSIAAVIRHQQRSGLAVALEQIGGHIFLIGPGIREDDIEIVGIEADIAGLGFLGFQPGEAETDFHLHAAAARQKAGVQISTGTSKSSASLRAACTNSGSISIPTASKSSIAARHAIAPKPQPHSQNRPPGVIRIWATAATPDKPLQIGRHEAGHPALLLKRIDALIRLGQETPYIAWRFRLIQFQGYFDQRHTAFLGVTSIRVRVCRIGRQLWSTLSESGPNAVSRLNFRVRISEAEHRRGFFHVPRWAFWLRQPANGAVAFWQGPLSKKPPPLPRKHEHLEGAHDASATG